MCPSPPLFLHSSAKKGEVLPSPRKTLINSRSFGRRVRRKEDLAEALAMHCAISGERLRAEGLEAFGLAVHMETSRYGDRPWSEIGASVRFPFPTSLTSDFIRAANEALGKCYKSADYMKGGVMLFDIVSKDSRQLTLAEVCASPEKTRERKLMEAMDHINDKHGRDTLHFAAQGANNAFWRMQRNLMSRRFTTRWDELLTVR